MSSSRTLPIPKLQFLAPDSPTVVRRINHFLQVDYMRKSSKSVEEELKLGKEQLGRAESDALR
jgi:hypothetical protein